MGRMAKAVWCFGRSLVGAGVLGAATLSPIAPASAATAPPLTPEERQIAGVWNLLSAEFTMLDGGAGPVPRLERPSGKVIYHPSHHFCFFITRAQDGTAKTPTPEDGLTSYCGTWSIDPKTQTMNPQTEMDARPSQHSILRRPHYDFREGKYRLFPPFNPKEVKAYILTFEKVSD